MTDSHKLNETQPDSMADSSTQSLAPGFRFHPTDEELVLYYLKRKVLNKPLRFDPIAIIDIYKLEPWDLPGQSRLKSRDLEWYFFSALETKYGNGWRTNRATEQGYWKTTGKDRNVRHGERVVGMKKTLVFHIGRAPKGERTNWVMHEYRLVDEELEKSGLKQAAFVLIRVFEKSGTGPKNGEQYGAPFIEEEWETDVLMKPKQEVGENQQEFQHQNANEQDLALAVIPSNVLPLSSDGGDSSNHVEQPKDFSEDGQKVFIGNGENARMPDDEQTSVEQEQFQTAEQFQMSEEFQMDDAPVDNEFFEVECLLNVANGCSDELADEATSHDAPVVNGQFGELNPVEPDRAGFDMLDEYLNYFDATDNDYFFELDSLAIPEVGDPNLNQSAFTEVNENCEQTSVDLPGPSNTHVGEGSSSAQKPEMAKIADDVQYGKDWDGSFAKQVSRMLGSIPASNAFAAEMPTKEASFGQNSATSSSVHVTAGMIHISGTVSGSGDVWSLGKTRDAAFILPFNMTLRTEMTMEPMSNIVSNKVMGNMMRSGYYFILFWVVILSVSCKIGSYIYSK